MFLRSSCCGCAKEEVKSDSLCFDSDDDNTDYEQVIYDSFESIQSEYHNINEVKPENGITDKKTSQEKTNVHGFHKFKKNVAAFKKNASQDFSNSLKRISKKIQQTDISDWQENRRRKPTEKSNRFIRRMKRSVSLPALSVTNQNSQQHRSMFYLTLLTQSVISRSERNRMKMIPRSKPDISGNNSDDENTDYEYVSYDSFESDTDSDYHQVNEVELRRDVADNPLPPEPVDAQHNGFDKLTKNISRFKKNFSRDFTKSLRRLSKRIYQIDLNDSENDNGPPSTINSSDPTKENEKLESNDSSKSDGFLTRIKRSVSLSAVSVTNLANYFDNQNAHNQRRSTFYVTDPINFEDEFKNLKSSSAAQSVTSINSKCKVIRPKMPPPPVPHKNSDKEKSFVTPEIKKPINKNSIPRKTTVETIQNKNTSWYTESGLYSKTLPTRVKKKKVQMNEQKRHSSKNSIYKESIDTKVFSNVIEELNFKLNKTNEQSNNNTNNNYENESNYNQSVYSYSSNDSKKDYSSVTDNKNDITFLDDEPLYQFYDAALIGSAYDDDMASDFECDVYEDIVEEMNENYISSSITGHMDQQNSTQTFTRSLWCEIPEVMKSAVLSTLSPQQKKLQEAKFEIITSEASYLNSLNVLMDHFETKFKNSNIVNEKELEILFGKVREVRACSKKLQHDLEKCWQSNILLDGLCDLIQKHAEENFEVYIPYCENQIVISETLNRLRERTDFSEFLTNLESSPTCQFLSLYSFLMLPMQRITRWPLLVDAILKRLSEADPEYLTCQYVLATMNKTVSQCNEAARRKEQEIELKKIADSLEFDKDVPPININIPERILVRSGSMIRFQPRNEDTRMTFGKRFSKITLNLFVFSDLFVVSKKKTESTYNVLHYCPRNMIELRSIDMFPTIMKKDAQDKQLLYLSILENQNGKVVEFLLSASTESDKERWIEAFTPPKSENPDETLYECWDCPQVTALHNYNGCQPDELSLSRGDVINVVRKMNDGWYCGERIRDGQTGWFPANYTVEIINPHVRARNLKQRYRLLRFSENYLKS